MGYHQHPPDWIRLLGERIRAVHLKDFNCSVGNLSGFCDRNPDVCVTGGAAFRIIGQSNLTFPVDRKRCARWNVAVSDVQAVVDTAVGGKPFSLAAVRAMYAALHQCDEAGAEWIVVEALPEGGEWNAIADRLGRAAAS